MKPFTIGREFAVLIADDKKTVRVEIDDKYIPLTREQLVELMATMTAILTVLK